MASRGFIVLLIMVAALSGCASLSVGPVGVMSSDLGYESPYLGAQAVAVANSGPWEAEGKVSALAAKKAGSVEGNGFTAQVLAGRRVGGLSVLVGASGGRQHADEWDKEVFQPAAAMRWNYKAGRSLGVIWLGEDSHGEIQNVYGLTLDAAAPGKKFPGLSLQLESVDWRQGNKNGTGMRATAALLWGIR